MVAYLPASAVYWVDQADDVEVRDDGKIVRRIHVDGGVIELWSEWPTVVRSAGNASKRYSEYVQARRPPARVISVDFRQRGH